MHRLYGMIKGDGPVLFRAREQVPPPNVQSPPEKMTVPRIRGAGRGRKQNISKTQGNLATKGSTGVHSMMIMITLSLGMYSP